MHVWKVLEQRRPSGRGPQESNLGALRPSCWLLPPLRPCLPVWFAGARFLPPETHRGAELAGRANRTHSSRHTQWLGIQDSFLQWVGPVSLGAVGWRGIERPPRWPSLRRHRPGEGRERGQGAQDLPKPGSHSKAS